MDRAEALRDQASRLFDLGRDLREENAPFVAWSSVTLAAIELDKAAKELEQAGG